MKEIAALGAAALIAAAGALWFTTKPALVQTEVAPLQARDDMPTFKPIR
jgi:hypothetical protein